MKVLGEYVIIQPMVEEMQKGFFIPSAKKNQEKRSLSIGTVKFTGAEVHLGINVGDKVCYIEGTYWKNGKRKNPDEFEYYGEKLIGICEKEIKFIIHE